jgi:threonine/homoserine/homoserine lactone efflux protein
MALTSNSPRNHEMLTLYLISTTLLILAPGPNMLMMIALASSQGARAGRTAALGLMSGVLVHTLVATTGGSLVLQQWPSALYVIRVLGSLYLISMGGRMVWAQLWATPTTAAGVAVTRTPYMQGLVSSITNTKTLVFFVSFLPQFMDVQHSIAGQFIVLGAIYAGLTLAIYGLIGSVAGWAGAVLQRPLVQRVLRIVAGCVIAGLGVWGAW